MKAGRKHKHKSNSKSCFIPDNGFRSLLGLSGQSSNMEQAARIEKKQNSKKHIKRK